MKLDLHTHYYPEAFFKLLRDTPSEFSFDKDPTGRTIITHHGARFFGVTPPMSDPQKRLEDMDRVGIDVEVISLSTPNIFFADEHQQPTVARVLNDAYAELISRHPERFKGFASIPMDAPDAALAELHRAIDELKLNGVILLSNIKGRALTAPIYRPFFEEANRMKLCIFLHPMIPVYSEPFREYVLGPLVGFPFDTTLAVARMCFDGMLADLPDNYRTLPVGTRPANPCTICRPIQALASHRANLLGIMLPCPDSIGAASTLRFVRTSPLTTSDADGLGRTS